jgi:glycosyltransferase involved in cell wall biosynthesis
LIIPVYQTESTLRRCLNSAVAQTLSDLEIIVVNDGSPGNCRAIVDEYRNDPRIRLYSHWTNRGIYQARRTGFRHSTGRYIVQLDSDDELIDPSCIAALVDEMDRTQVDIHCYRVEAVLDDPDWPWDTSAFEKSAELDLTGDEIWRACYLEGRYMWHLWSKIMRRELYERAYQALGAFSTQTREDFFLYTQLSLGAKRLTGRRETYYRYYVGLGTSTRKVIPDLALWKRLVDDGATFERAAAACARRAPEFAAWLLERKKAELNHLVWRWGQHLPEALKAKAWRHLERKWGRLVPKP